VRISEWITRELGLLRVHTARKPYHMWDVCAKRFPICQTDDPRSRQLFWYWNSIQDIGDRRGRAPTHAWSEVPV